MKRAMVLVALLSTTAHAAGFGAEFDASGGLLSIDRAVPFFEFALNARLSRKTWGGLEFWVRGFPAPLLLRRNAGFVVGTTVVWRTPFIVTGDFNWSLATGIGVTGGGLCLNGDVCELVLGPRVEFMPTVEFVASEVVRPYLALVTSATFAIPPQAAWLTAGLGIGVHFDFSAR